MDLKKVEFSLVSLSLLGGCMWAGRAMMEKSREPNANICILFLASVIQLVNTLGC